jgi:hypothetical protein
MKILVMTLFVLINFQALASDTNDKKAERIEKVRAKMLEHMDKRIAALQTAKSCISSADSKESFKACREPLKALRQEQKQQRQQRKERRQNKK